MVCQPVRHDACRRRSGEGTSSDQPQRHSEPHRATRRPAGLHEVSFLQRGLLQGAAFHRGASPTQWSQRRARAGDLLRSPLWRLAPAFAEEGDQRGDGQGDGGRERFRLDAGQLLRQGQKGRTQIGRLI